MKRTIPLVVILVLAIGAGIAFWLSPKAVHSPMRGTVAKQEQQNQKTPVSLLKAPEEPIQTPGAKLSAEVTKQRGARASASMPTFRAMDDAGRGRVEAMAIKLSGVNTEFGDLYSLAMSEAPDLDWSARTERAIDVALRGGGQGFSDLQVGEPHCSATVCVVEAAVNPGADSRSRSSDWQSLIGSVYSEPWFAENFMDARIVMADDAAGTVYISVFERKQ